MKNNRQLSFGSYSLTLTLIVLASIGLINFLGTKYFKQFDVTSSGFHSLSDQTKKVVKELKKEVVVTLIIGPGEKDKYNLLLENYKGLSKTLKVETIDKVNDLMALRRLGVKNGDVAIVKSGNAEKRLSEVNEEQLTNAIIKVAREKVLTFCAGTGHGEKSFQLAEADGYEMMKTSLENQGFGFREINLDLTKEIPSECSTLAIIGPSAAIPAQTLEALRAYLRKGGRLVASLETSAKGADPASDFSKLLGEWGLKPGNEVVIDPTTNLQGISEIIGINMYDTSHPVTKDFSALTLFPITRSIEVSEKAPDGVQLTKLAQSTAQALLVKFGGAQGGNALEQSIVAGRKGPFVVAAAAEGKLDSTATAVTKIVLIGSAQFANNQFSRLLGNGDFFQNALSWTMDDESTISIRPKDQKGSKLALTETQSLIIQLLSTFIIPFLIAGLGIVVWWKRKKL